MPDYRAEIWFRYLEDRAEDTLEELIKGLLRDNGMYPQATPVVFRMYQYQDAIR